MRIKNLILLGMLFISYQSLSANEFMIPIAPNWNSISYLEFQGREIAFIAEGSETIILRGNLNTAEIELLDPHSPQQNGRYPLGNFEPTFFFDLNTLHYFGIEPPFSGSGWMIPEFDEHIYLVGIPQKSPYFLDFINDLPCTPGFDEAGCSGTFLHLAKLMLNVYRSVKWYCHDSDKVHDDYDTESACNEDCIAMCKTSPSQ